MREEGRNSLFFRILREVDFWRRGLYSPTLTGKRADHDRQESQSARPRAPATSPQRVPASAPRGQRNPALARAAAPRRSGVDRRGDRQGADRPGQRVARPRPSKWRASSIRATNMPRPSGYAARSSPRGRATPTLTTSSASRLPRSARPDERGRFAQARHQDQCAGAELPRQSRRGAAPGRQARRGEQAARASGQAGSQQRPGAEQPRHHPLRPPEVQRGGRLLPPGAGGRARTWPKR